MPLTSELMQSDEQLISYYKAKAPEYAQQLDVIHSYVSTASLITNEDDLKEYTQGCVQIISDAQLPLTERKALVSSVVVAESRRGCLFKAVIISVNSNSHMNW